VKNVLRPVLALAVALALSGGVLAGPASAAGAGPGPAAREAAADHDERDGDYLALGDSVPFGFSPLITVGGAASRYVGYPQLAASTLDLRLTNLSCPGETSGSFLDATAPDNGCRRFRSAAPLHTAYPRTQAEAVAAFLGSHPRTRLVTLMIGANDLLLCQQATTDRCTQQLPAVLAGYRAHLQAILHAIRQRYHGRLELVTYYSTDYSDPSGTGAIKALDAVVRAQAGTHGAVVADGFTAFARLAAAAGGKTCDAHLLIALPTGGCDIHPSAKGVGVLAGTVVAAAHRRAA
jgi:lysophospholipase L1-like esterase